jgi:hypothetical protein
MSSPSLSLNSPAYDTPFIYSKAYYQAYTANPSTVTGVFDDVIKSDGDSDFFARRAVNVNNFNNQNGEAFISPAPGTIAAQALGNDYPLAPEKLFVLGADIPIELTLTNGVIGPSVALLTFTGGVRVNVACPMFQGVKRRVGIPDVQPDYRFHEKPFTYVVEFEQNWTYLVAPFTDLQASNPVSLFKPINDFDFELQALEFSADFNNTTFGYNGYMVKLYDANGYALMKDFVHYRQISYNGGYDGAQVVGTPGHTLPYFPNCFPVPPVIFPRGSIARIDVISLLDSNGGGGTQFINLRGVRRKPC